MIDGGRVFAVEVEVCLAAHGLGQRPGQVPHAAFDQVQCFVGQGPYRAPQHGMVGDDVVGRTCMDLRHADDAGFQRVQVAGQDGLEGQGELCRDHHGIHAQVRHGAVGAAAAQRDVERAAGGHDGAAGQSECAGRHAGPVVHAEHGLHGELFEQAVLDHAACAAAGFFGGLEDDVHDPVEIAVLRQVPCGRQQHGGVAVMAAGVHGAGVAAGVCKGVGFRHGQGVHVGTQTQGPAGTASGDAADHAGFTQAAVDLDSPGFQQASDGVGRADFLEGQFGPGMDGAPDVGHFGLPAVQGLENVLCHGVRLIRWSRAAAMCGLAA